MELIRHKMPSRKPREILSELKPYQDLAATLAAHLGRPSSEPLRTSPVLLELQKSGLSLQNIEQAIFSPRIIVKLHKLPKLVTLPAIQRRFTTEILLQLRGNLTLAEAAKKLNLATLSTYHHWETGRRDIPLVYFLRAIDIFSGRLVPFLETLPFPVKAPHFAPKAEIYKQFFSQPWIPTLFLALRLPKVLALKTTYHQAAFLGRALNISAAEIELGLDVLLRLGLARLEEGRFVSDPKQMYAIPSLPPAETERIHKFWFGQSADLLKNPGFHKVEQHATTLESKEKIILWISELREKIRKEVKLSGEPETLIHINWQLTELL